MNVIYEQQEKFSPFYLSLKRDVKIIQNIESILDKIESEGNISLLTSTFEMIFNKEMVYAVQELKKLRLKQPKLDLKTQLTNNTEIFKENLKTITSLLIEQIWRDKINTQKIQETIDWANQLIYKGTFEEIQEVDEEQMYNSWMFQKQETDKNFSEFKHDTKFEVPSKENLEIPNSESEEFLELNSDENDIKKRLVGKIKKSLDDEKELMSRFSSQNSFIDSSLDISQEQPNNPQTNFKKFKGPLEIKERSQEKRGQLSVDKNNDEFISCFPVKSIHDTLIDKLEKLQQQKTRSNERPWMKKEYCKTTVPETIQTTVDLTKFISNEEKIKTKYQEKHQKNKKVRNHSSHSNINQTVHSGKSLSKFQSVRNSTNFTNPRPNLTVFRSFKQQLISQNQFTQKSI